MITHAILNILKAFRLFNGDETGKVLLMGLGRTYLFGKETNLWFSLKNLKRVTAERG